MISNELEAWAAKGPLRIISRPAMNKLQALPDLRSRRGRRDGAILVLLNHGLRPMEVAQMRAAHILTSDPLRFRFPGKGGLVRTIAVFNGARIIRKFLDSTEPTDYLFPYRAGFIATRTIQRIAKVYASRLGIEDLHPMMLRHSTATHLVHETGDLWKVAEFLGHTPDVCATYYAGYLVTDADALGRALK